MTMEAAKPGERMVTLVDGSAVSNYSEEWRMECEARSILNTKGVGARQERLARIAKFRGEAATEALKDVMISVWNSVKGVHLKRD